VSKNPSILARSMTLKPITVKSARPPGWGISVHLSTLFVSYVGWAASLMPRRGNHPLLNYIVRLLNSGSKSSPPVSRLRKNLILSLILHHTVHQSE
jgi:hypothetical protein